MVQTLKEITMAEVTYKVQKSPEFPHVEWIELHGDGVMHECVVMKRDKAGNVLFFKTNDLDAIDKRRLGGILVDRQARHLELWDIMSQKTLGNGMNALVYFSQLVKQLTTNGKILDPRSGQVGTGQVGTPTAQQ
jgi:hypothetical protein